MAEEAGISDLKEGDKILFNNRKTPLTVSSKSGNNLKVEGPSGGEYLIYEDEGSLLVSKDGNKRYSSYCKNLRKVGDWEKTQGVWKHSISNAEISLEKMDNGFWSICSEKFNDEIDTPKYGFTSKEDAVEKIMEFVENHPEG